MRIQEEIIKSIKISNNYMSDINTKIKKLKDVKTAIKQTRESINNEEQNNLHSVIVNKAQNYLGNVQNAYEQQVGVLTDTNKLIEEKLVERKKLVSKYVNDELVGHLPKSKESYPSDVPHASYYNNENLHLINPQIASEELILKTKNSAFSPVEIESKHYWKNGISPRLEKFSLKKEIRETYFIRSLILAVIGKVIMGDFSLSDTNSWNVVLIFFLTVGRIIFYTPLIISTMKILTNYVRIKVGNKVRTKNGMGIENIYHYTDDMKFAGLLTQYDTIENSWDKENLNEIIINNNLGIPDEFVQSLTDLYSQKTDAESNIVYFEQEIKNAQIIINYPLNNQAYNFNAEYISLNEPPQFIAPSTEVLRKLQQNEGNLLGDINNSYVEFEKENENIVDLMNQNKNMGLDVSNSPLVPEQFFMGYQNVSENIDITKTNLQFIDNRKKQILLKYDGSTTQRDLQSIVNFLGAFIFYNKEFINYKLYYFEDSRLIEIKRNKELGKIITTGKLFETNAGFISETEFINKQAHRYNDNNGVIDIETINKQKIEKNKNNYSQEEYDVYIFPIFVINKDSNYLEDLSNNLLPLEKSGIIPIVFYDDNDVPDNFYSTKLYREAKDDNRVYEIDVNTLTMDEEVLRSQFYNTEAPFTLVPQSISGFINDIKTTRTNFSNI